MARPELTMFDAQMKLSKFSGVFMAEAERLIAAKEGNPELEQAVATFKAFIEAWSEFSKKQSGLPPEEWERLRQEAEKGLI